MARRPGDRTMTSAERLEIRRRIAAGEGRIKVAAAMGRTTMSVNRVLARSGGLAPRPTLRSPLRLAVPEREEISRGLERGESLRRISAGLGRSPSTVSREVAAGGGR